jgi:hypothetical protein
MNAPVPTAEFVKVFGTYRVPATVNQASALCSEMEARLAASKQDPVYTAEQRERAVTTLTHFLQVARARRAQLMGVSL